jgi:hypothetical protein
MHINAVRPGFIWLADKTLNFHLDIPKIDNKTVPKMVAGQVHLGN